MDFHRCSLNIEWVLFMCQTLCQEWNAGVRKNHCFGGALRVLGELSCKGTAT